MIRSFLSRYRPRFIRSLVYMLQASEYDAGDFLRWYSRTKDFSQVEKRKQLEMTKAAKILLAGLYVWAFILYTPFLLGLAGTIYSTVVIMATWEPVLPYGAVLWTLRLLVHLWVIPRILVISLALVAWLGKILVQKPREQAVVVRVRKQLSINTATKIAVAGSFGKTTFKDILLTVLSEGKLTAATPGNLNTPIGISRFMADLDGDEEVLIFELGEYYPGDIKRLADMTQPDMGVITGINEAHLEKFKTLERTVATIYELGDYLDKKPLWVNGESELAKSASRPHHRVYDRSGVNGWKVSKINSDLNGTSFAATKGKVTIHAKSGLLGLHQVGPLVAVIDIAHQLGLSKAQIEAGIANTKPFAHRMQPAENGGVVTIDDTYNGNPNGVAAGLEFMRGLKGKRRIYVTPGLVEMGARSAEVHREIGRQLADSVDVVGLVKNSVTPYIEEGLKEKGFKGEIIWYPDGMSSLVALPKLTVAGDVVLLQNDWGDQYA